MLRSTFQLGPRLGAGREMKLWQAGIWEWRQVEAPLPPFVGVEFANRLRRAVQLATAAAESRDAAALAALVPMSEHWRLLGMFEEQVAFLDIETDATEGITAIGLLDARGPRILLGEREVSRFPEELGAAAMLVTFNGGSFDVPVLRRRFPEWTPPPLHVDLRHLWHRLGHRGGLKALEEAQGIGRPQHLRGMTGHDAVWLWRRAQYGDVAALRLFAEYNLYDTINLRTLLDIAHNRMLASLAVPGAPRPVSHRGDVLYDVSKVLMTLGGE